jgi:hypothetical protein
LLTGALEAILITGDFDCRFGMADASPARKGDQTQDPDKIVTSAREAMKTALGDKKDDAALVLVTYCFTRTHSLERFSDKEKGRTARKEEYEAMTKDIAAPVFGAMDDIEIGHPATGQPPVARVDQVNVCVISRKK